MSQLSREDRQRVSMLIQLIPLSIRRVANANPNGMNYVNWKRHLEEQSQEFYDKTGERFDATKVEDYNRKYLRSDK